MQNAMQEYMDKVYANAHLNPQKKKLLDNGYERYIVREGCLLDDEMWIHPDTIKATIDNTHNPKYIFFFFEKYVNEWSSTQTMRRCKKLPKKYYKYVMLG